MYVLHPRAVFWVQSSYLVLPQDRWGVSVLPALPRLWFSPPVMLLTPGTPRHGAVKITLLPSVNRLGCQVVCQEPRWQLHPHSSPYKFKVNGPKPDCPWSLLSLEPRGALASHGNGAQHLSHIKQHWGRKQGFGWETSPCAEMRHLKHWSRFYHILSVLILTNRVRQSLIWSVFPTLLVTTNANSAWLCDGGNVDVAKEQR